jgi:hypothetical protein
MCLFALNACVVMSLSCRGIYNDETVNVNPEENV